MNDTSFDPIDTAYMTRALELAKKAAELGEVPVGAVIVKNGEIIGEGFNLRETEKRSTAHAELIAIEAACQRLSGWRLPDCTLYVTLEPCPMCAGAIVNSRIPRVVFAAKDFRAGAFGSLIDLNHYPLNHKPIIEYGLMQDEARMLLRDFFRSRRK